MIHMMGNLLPATGFLNPKSQAPNPKQIQISNVQNVTLRSL
jgi:hypothetical protein